jgi:hypothetical protein
MATRAIAAIVVLLIMTDLPVAKQSKARPGGRWTLRRLFQWQDAHFFGIQGFHVCGVPLAAELDITALVSRFGYPAYGQVAWRWMWILVVDSFVGSWALKSRST